MNRQAQFIPSHLKIPKIFVSYSRRDHEILVKEFDFIGGLGCQVFVDHQMNPGDHWAGRLANEINDCDIFLVFLTKNSINSQYVSGEINYAVRINKKIIPIFFGGICLPPEIDLLIGRIQKFEKYTLTQGAYEEKLKCAIWGGQSVNFLNNYSHERSDHVVVNFGEHDKNLLGEIGQLFSFDVIKTIGEDRFGVFVSDNVIRPVNNFIERSEDPLYRFKSGALEAMRLDALSKAEAFIRHFTQECAGAVGGYDYIERRYGCADELYFRNHSIKTSELAIDFCNAISKLRAELINC